MKNQLLKFVFFGTFICSVYAQQITQCDFVPSAGYLDTAKYSNRYQTIPDDGRKFILNVKFHYVLGLNGENPNALSEEKMLHILATMNINFNSFGVFFKYRGTDFIEDDNYTIVGQNGLTQTSLIAKFTELNYYTDDVINVFVIRGNGNQGSNGRMFLDANSTLAIMDAYIPHEMGHVLGLIHVDSGTVGVEQLNNHLPPCILSNYFETWQNMKRPIFSTIGTTENVTREVNNPKYNADIAGDRVHDTDASYRSGLYDYQYSFCRQTTFPYNFINFNEDPRIVDNSGDSNISSYYCFNSLTKYSYFTGNNYYTTATNGLDVTSNNLVYNNIPLNNQTWQNIISTILTNCTAIGSGETYKIANNFVNNHMGIGQTPRIFTNGQGKRIRETLLGNLPAIFGSLQSKLNLTEDGSPDIEVLYEPFAIGGGSDGSGISTIAYSKTASPNETFTGANIWNCGPFTMRFQTGFDCDFYFGNSTITQTPHQQFNATTSTQIGVKIPILGQQIYNNAAPVCFFSFEPYTSGDVKSTQNLGATYYTQEELDTIKASDPNLYELLQSGKYHIITKNTDSGFSNQKIIYKE